MENKAPGTISMLELSVALWRRKALILASMLAFLAAGIALRHAQKPLYESDSKFLCKTASQGGGNELDALARFAGLRGPASAGNDPSAYFTDILVDEDFLSHILDRKWPYQGDSAYLSDIWKMKPDQRPADWERVWRKRMVSILRSPKRISLTKNRNGVFVLEVYFESPELSYAINSYLIDRLNDYIRQNLLSNTRNKRVFIEQRLREVDEELRRNEDELVNFREKNREVLSPKLMVEQGRLERKRTVSQEIFLQLKKEYEFAKIDEQKDSPLIEIISKPTIATEKSRNKLAYAAPLGAVFGLFLGIVLAWLLHFAPWRAFKAAMRDYR